MRSERIYASLAVALPVAAATLAAFSAEATPVRLTLALLALGVLTLAAGMGRWRLQRAVADRLLLALALAALAHATAPNLVRWSTTPTIRVWNVFHYYLGAKYFAELGYHDLYPAALAADAEGEDYWRRIERVRNQVTYDIESRAEAARRFDPATSFTPQRWAAFRRDVAALQSFRSPRAWRNIFTDRGYNASPFWGAVGRALTALLPADRLVALKLLTGLDLLLMAATFWLLRRAFGPRAAALVLLLFALTPVNAGRLVGGFLQYDWFCAIAAGVAWQRLGKPVASAAALAYATLARIFPALLVASLLAPAALRWVKSGHLDRRIVRFTAAFILFCLAGFAAGGLAGRGLSAWGEFAAGIAHHAQEHVYGEQRVGLKHLFTHDLASHQVADSSRRRRATFARQEVAYRAVAVTLLALWALALVRRRGHTALLLGLLPVFALSVSSRYYWACLALVPLAVGSGAGSPRHRRRLVLAAAQAALFAAFYLLYLRLDDRYAAYLLFNLLLTLYLAGWAGWLLARNLRLMQRARSRRE